MPKGTVRKIGHTLTLVVLALMVLFGFALIMVEYTDVGDVLGASSAPGFSNNDLSQVPDGVRKDAQELAGEILGPHTVQARVFARQLLVTYLDARDKDFILVYNPGGWGSSLLRESPGWQSIVNGIEGELNSQGYELLPLNYRRTQHGWIASLDEISEMAIHYNHKAKILAARFDFLTDHNPHVRVIMASESNGSIISDQVMILLKDNDRVYDIQTGTPPWYHPPELERTLIINNNGEVPDSFSNGDFPAIIDANLKMLTDFHQQVANGGHILKVFRAPGHVYNWEQPRVSKEVCDFLDEILAASKQPGGMQPG